METEQSHALCLSTVYTYPIRIFQCLKRARIVQTGSRGATMVGLLARVAPAKPLLGPSLLLGLLRRRQAGCPHRRPSGSPRWPVNPRAPPRSAGSRGDLASESTGGGFETPVSAPQPATTRMIRYVLTRRLTRGSRRMTNRRVCPRLGLRAPGRLAERPCLRLESKFRTRISCASRLWAKHMCNTRFEGRPLSPKFLRWSLRGRRSLICAKIVQRTRDFEPGSKSSKKSLRVFSSPSCENMRTFFLDSANESLAGVAES
mmetsp:Transcript_63316/g.142801  ORF Transcript_63316/g.142801 Transcript_63316/m.142801 type:complete len:259 (-) Transcript_63316:1769-2545(-)